MELSTEELLARMPYVASETEFNTGHRSNGRSHEEPANLPGRLIFAQEEERRRIAAELHDDLGQDIAAILMEMKSISKTLGGRRSNLRAAFDRVYDRTVNLSEKMRQVSHQLHPVALKFLGLNAALQSLCSELRNEGLDIQLILPEQEPVLDPKTKLSFFRVAQESLRNVIRHSRSRFARVRLEIQEFCVALTVQDYGIGFDQSRNESGLGLFSLAQRARLIRGDFQVESSPGFGTQVLFRSRVKKTPVLAKAR